MVMRRNIDNTFDIAVAYVIDTTAYYDALRRNRAM